jgi:hypothetical protein
MTKLPVAWRIRTLRIRRSRCYRGESEDFERVQRNLVNQFKRLVNRISECSTVKY